MKSALAFTLVELLVVITIIVVLLALLAPALDKAVHQAVMAVCAGNQHGVAHGQITYAMDHKRWYPYRAALHEPATKTIEHRQLTVPAGWNQSFNVQGFDERTILRPFVPINSLNCPKVDKLDLEGGDAIDTAVFGSFTRFAGWRYHVMNDTQGVDTTNPLAPGRAASSMMKLGDRWTFYVGGGKYAVSSRILGGDHYQIVGGAFDDGTIQASSPDNDDLVPLETLDQQGTPYKATVSQWRIVWGGHPNDFKFRLDVNYHYDDGSVERFNGLGSGGKDKDRRARRVPAWNRQDYYSALIVPNDR